MRTNKHQVPEVRTAAGGRAVSISNEQQLTRLVNACFLWEDGFYIEGVKVAEMLKELVAACRPEFVAALAVEARHTHHLRHAPLLLAAALANHPDRARFSKFGERALIAQTIQQVISRADELGEFMSLYAGVLGVAPRAIGGGNGFKKKLSAQVKRGVAAAFDKFGEYHFAKYNREGAFTLRDVARLVHPGASGERGELYRRIFKGEALAAAGTWEERLSAGEDKKTVWTSMLQSGSLGYSALLKNLRNMEQVGVDHDLIKAAILARRGAGNVLPFRFLAAAREAKRFENELDTAMQAALADVPKLPGKTVVIVDVSGSMGAALSSKSSMDRLDAACAMAAIIKGCCENTAVYATAGSDALRKHATELCPPRHGMALIDAIKLSRVRIGQGGIFLKQVMDFVAARETDVTRTVVITDEQDCAIGAGDTPQQAKLFSPANYMLNVSTERNGIGYRNGWTHIDGFSEAVVRFIAQHEVSEANK